MQMHWQLLGHLQEENMNGIGYDNVHGWIDSMLTEL